MPAEIKSIGFIGLGDMGSKQVREIAKLPVSLAVFDTRAEAMQPFADRAMLAPTIAALGAVSDLVGICVMDDAQVTSCVEELLPVMKADSIILIHSTISPATVTALAARAKALGIELRDAPVARTRITNDGPFVFCPMGGDAELKARVQPILDSFATDTLLAGPIGAAMALKICNNLISWCEIVVALEAVALAEKAGLAPDLLVKLTGTNGLLTPPMKIFADFYFNPRDDERWRHGIVNAALAGEKDLSLAEGLGGLSGAQTPLASFLRGIVEEKVQAILRHS